MAVTDEKEVDIRIFPVDREGNKFGRGPIEGASLSDFTEDLNGAGSASISFHPLARNAQHVKLLKREIQIWFDDELVWWGVPWRASGDFTSVTIDCEGILSLLTKRFVDRASLLYTSIDQLSIGWGLVSYAQNESVQAHRDLNISSAVFAPSGVPRSREYSRENHPMILDLLAEFPTLDNGFDFSIEYDETGNRWWTPYYPRRGSLKSNMKIFLDVDNNSGVRNFTYSEDAMSTATDVYVTGGANGDVKFEGHWWDDAAAAEWGVQQAVISDGNQLDATWLLDRAKKEVEDRKRTIVQPVIATTKVPRDYFSKVQVGDWLPVYVDYGFYQIEDQYRVGSKSWSPEGPTFTFVEAVQV